MTIRRAAALITALAWGSATCLAACSAPDEPADPAITASLTQYRVDEAQHRVQVKLRQEAGARAVRVTEVVVRLPGFADGPVRRFDSSTRSGGALDLPAVYGPAQCRGDAPVSGAPTAVLRLDGVDVEVRIDDPHGLAERLWRRECAVRAVLAAVPVELGTTWTRRSVDGSGLAPTLVSDGELVLGPVADGHTAEVVELVGTTLFGVEVAGRRTLPVTATDQPVVLPVTVAAQRCDPHAVGESKRGYAFGVRLVVDGGEPVLVTISPTEPARRQMEAVLLERCGLD